MPVAPCSLFRTLTRALPHRKTSIRKVGLSHHKNMIQTEGTKWAAIRHMNTRVWCANIETPRCSRDAHDFVEPWAFHFPTCAGLIVYGHGHDVTEGVYPQAQSPLLQHPHHRFADMIVYDQTHASGEAEKNFMILTKKSIL